MKRFKYLTAVVAIISVMLMTACNYFYSGRFDGGELLNDDIMESIRNELFSNEDSISDNTENRVTEAEKSENATSSNIDETNLTENDNNVDTLESSCDTETIADNSIVYWTEKGSVWHLYKDCGYLSKSKDIKSGSVQNAVDDGKDKLCSSCEKKQNK